MSDQKRYLIVGLGSIGRRHLANLRQLRPNSRIAALRRSAGADAGAEQPDEVVHTLDGALAFGPDAAVIASPAPFHVEAARALMTAGIPVLIEKPLADSLKGAERLMEFTSSAIALVGYNLRFEPAVQRMHQLLGQGAVGEVRLARGYVGQYLPDWRPGQDYRTAVSARRELGGGPLLELSHEIDLACWLFGRPDTVQCRGGRYSTLEIDVEDAVELMLGYKGPERLVTLGLNFLDRSPTRRFSVIGSEATLTWDGNARTIILDNGRTREAQAWDHADWDRNAAYLAELDHFLSCAVGNATPMIGLDDGLTALAVVEAARQSMRRGAEVRLGSAP